MYSVGGFTLTYTNAVILRDGSRTNLIISCSSVSIATRIDAEGKTGAWPYSSTIYVYNAETLEFIKEVATPQYEHGAGGMAAYNGHIWLTGGLPDGAPGNIILEFTEDLEFVKRHDSPGFTKAGIQTIKRMCGFWWYGVYDKPANVLCDDNFVIIARPKGPSVADRKSVV